MSFKRFKESLGKLRAVLAQRDNDKYLEYLNGIREGRLTLSDVPLEFKSKELCLEAIKVRSIAYRDLPREFKEDREFCLEAVKENGMVYQYLPSEFKEDREICLAAVKQNGWVYKYLPREFREDREICLEAVKQNGAVYAFLPREFREDREICLEAVKQNGAVYKYIPPEFQQQAMEDWSNELEAFGYKGINKEQAFRVYQEYSSLQSFLEELRAL